MRSDFIMAENIKELFFTAETQRALRVNSINPNRETAIGLMETLQDVIKRCIYRADSLVWRYLPANKRFFSLRSLRLCGENVLCMVLIRS